MLKGQGKNKKAASCWELGILDQIYTQKLAPNPSEKKKEGRLKFSFSKKLHSWSLTKTMGEEEDGVENKLENRSAVSLNNDFKSWRLQGAALTLHVRYGNRRRCLLVIKN